MFSQKLESLLMVSLEATRNERETFDDLSAGVDSENDTWEIVVKYNSQSEDIFVNTITTSYPGTLVYPLLCNYSVIVTSRENVNLIAAEPIIEYVEKPKILYFDLINEKRESCVTGVTGGTALMLPSLSGRGVAVAVIDTGINVDDPAFKNPDGSTRILRMWDQNTDMYYDSDSINEEIAKRNNPVLFEDNFPGRRDAGSDSQSATGLFEDILRHGINVCKIACGNDGVAYGASIIFVKIKRSMGGFSTTTDMMRAVDYCIRTAASLSMPVALNISFGNNYGPHLSDDIQTSYINDVSGVWKCNICVGSGNEGEGAIHTQGDIGTGESMEFELAVREYETGISFAVWRSGLDRMDIKVVSPEGFSYIIPDNASVINRGKLGDVEIIAFNGQPKPFSSAMEVFIGLIPVNDYVTPGLWKLIITGNNIKNGHIDMWLPTTVTLNSGTGFLKPSSGLTYTIPSTAERVITVGAYDSLRNVVSTFSGRGYLSRTGYDVRVKPDLIAPGENVMINDTTVVSGTSFAVPFCTGAAALLMEWGIVRGNDPYMYGDKLKTYLQRGAKPIEGLDAPSSSQGWGRLCLRNSLPIDGM